MKADVAVAVFVRGALRVLVQRLRSGQLELPHHELLVEDLEAVIAEGGAARVHAPHLLPSALSRRGTTTARSVLCDLLESVHTRVRKDERTYLRIVDGRVRRGPLAERIAQQVSRRSRRRGFSEEAAIREVYEELADCLEKNRPWMSEPLVAVWPAT